MVISLSEHHYFAGMCLVHKTHNGMQSLSIARAEQRVELVGWLRTSLFINKFLLLFLFGHSTQVPALGSWKDFISKKIFLEMIIRGIRFFFVGSSSILLLAFVIVLFFFYKPWEVLHRQKRHIRNTRGERDYLSARSKSRNSARPSAELPSMWSCVCGSMKRPSPGARDRSPLISRCPPERPAAVGVARCR